jgi:hypothetical protein
LLVVEDFKMRVVLNKAKRVFKMFQRIAAAQTERRNYRPIDIQMLVNKNGHSKKNDRLFV